jgi:hypothetical protein
VPQLFITHSSGQDELKDKFDLSFQIVSREQIETSVTGARYNVAVRPHCQMFQSELPKGHGSIAGIFQYSWTVRGGVRCT